ncbi:hypothetical protein [Rothia terrae]|uniref:Uncharacterized protein n=1 Tax=Rothia terrae TaxID=396015 RepID=A0A7S6WW93_9MICC|nr:hypothetical protein [Rothia terrae]QOW64693.1 hypothetical protein IDM49_11360 [Rothia terrae]
MLIGLLIAAINIPLVNALACSIRNPWVFLALYLILGLMIVVAGYFLISLIIVPSIQTYALVALLSYASIGGNKMKEMKAARANTRMR